MSSITARGESGSLATSTGSKEKEPFRVQSELFASTRLAPKVHALYRARSLLTDVIAHECVLLALMSARLMYYARDSSTSDGTDADSDLPRIGILGGGHIGSAVALTLLKYQYPTDKIAISTRQPDRVPKCEALQSLQAQALFHTIPKYYDNARLSKESDLLVLCMPPSQLKSVAIQIKHALCVPEQPTVVISVLCGATVESLQKSCGSRLVTRAKVNVAMLTAPPLTITPNGNDRCEDGDGNGDVGNGADLEVEEARETAAARSSRRRSTVHIKQRRSSLELAARELGRQDEDVELLVQVLTELGLRLGQDQAQALRLARTAVFGRDVAEDGEDEPLVLRSAPSPPQQQTLAADGRCSWLSDWDHLLADTQRFITETYPLASSGGAQRVE